MLEQPDSHTHRPPQHPQPPNGLQPQQLPRGPDSGISGSTVPSAAIQYGCMFDSLATCASGGSLAAPSPRAKNVEQTVITTDTTRMLLNCMFFLPFLENGRLTRLLLHRSRANKLAPRVEPTAKTENTPRGRSGSHLQTLGHVPSSHASMHLPPSARTNTTDYP